MGKYFDQTLAELGANKLWKMGEGNSQFLLTDE